MGSQMLIADWLDPIQDTEEEEEEEEERLERPKVKAAHYEAVSTKQEPLPPFYQTKYVSSDASILYSKSHLRNIAHLPMIREIRLGNGGERDVRRTSLSSLMIQPLFIPPRPLSEDTPHVMKYRVVDLEMDRFGELIGLANSGGHLVIWNYEEYLDKLIQHEKDDVFSLYGSDPVCCMDVGQKPTSVSWNPVNCSIIGCGFSRYDKIHLYDLERCIPYGKSSPTVAFGSRALRGGVRDVAILNCGNVVLAAGNEGTLSLWDTRTGSKHVASGLSSPRGGAMSVEPAVDGHLVLVGTDSGNLEIFDTRRGLEKVSSMIVAKLSSLEGDGCNDRLAGQAIQSIVAHPLHQSEFAFQTTSGICGLIDVSFRCLRNVFYPPNREIDIIPTICHKPNLYGDFLTLANMGSVYTVDLSMPSSQYSEVISEVEVSGCSGVVVGHERSGTVVVGMSDGVLSGPKHPLINDLTRGLILKGYKVLHGIVSPSDAELQTVNYDPLYHRSILPLEFCSIDVDGDIGAVITLPLVDSPRDIADIEAGWDLVAIKGALLVERAAHLAKQKGARLLVISSTAIYGDALNSNAKRAWESLDHLPGCIPEGFRGYVSTFHTQAPFFETCRASEAWCSVAYREMGVDSVLARVGCVVGDYTDADGSFITSSWTGGSETVALSSSHDVAEALIELSSVKFNTPAPNSTPEHAFETTRVFNVASPSCVTGGLMAKFDGKWVTAKPERGGGYVDVAFITPDTRRIAQLLPEWAAKTKSGQEAWENFKPCSVEVRVYPDAHITTTPPNAPHVIETETMVPNKDKKLVILLGGAGFLGSNLAGRMLHDGYQVVCIDNLAAGLQSNIEAYSSRYKDDFLFVRHDVSLPFTLSSAFPRAYALVHAASLASPEFYYKDMAGTLLSGLQGTWNALNNVIGDMRYSLTSTSECYGDPLVHPQNIEYLGNVNTTGKRCQYDQSKRYAEVVSFAHLRRGVDVRISRIFNTYGDFMRPDDGRVITNFIDQALKGTPLTVYGAGLQTRSFTYMDDQVDGQMRLLTIDQLPGTHPLDRVYNLGNDVEEDTMVGLAEAVARQVKRIVGRDVSIIHTHWAEVVEHGMEIRDEAENKCKALNEGLRRGVGYIVVDDDQEAGKLMIVRDEYDPYDPRRRRADAQPARTVLGWKGPIVPVDRGLERLLQFLLVRKMELVGLDGRTGVFDYRAELEKVGLGVKWDYIQERKNDEVDEREASFITRALDQYHPQ